MLTIRPQGEDTAMASPSRGVQADGAEDDDGDDGSGWETASDEEEAAELAAAAAAAGGEGEVGKGLGVRAAGCGLRVASRD